MWRKKNLPREKKIFFEKNYPSRRRIEKGGKWWRKFWKTNGSQLKKNNTNKIIILPIRKYISLMGLLQS